MMLFSWSQNNEVLIAHGELFGGQEFHNNFDPKFVFKNAISIWLNIRWELVNMDLACV